MALSFTAGTPAQSTGSVTSINVTLPAGLVDGDYTILVCCSNSSSGGLNLPSGWTAILANTNTANGSTAGHHAIFYRKWVSGDPSTVAVTLTSGRVGVLPVKVSGADPSTFVEVAASVTQAASGATAITAPTKTSTASTVMCYTLLARSSNGTIITLSPNAGDTEVGEAGGASSQSQCFNSLNLHTITPGVASGTRTGTASSGTTGAMGVSFVLKESAAGPPQQVPVGQATEADVSQPMRPTKARTIKMARR